MLELDPPSSDLHDHATSTPRNAGTPKTSIQDEELVLEPGSFAAFVRHNGAVLSHLDVPQQLWVDLWEALRDGDAPTDAPNALQIATGAPPPSPGADPHGGELPEADSDDDEAGSRRPFAGAFRLAVRTDPATGRRMRLVVAARAMAPGAAAWAAAPWITSTSKAALLSQLSYDTGLLVQIADVLSYSDDDDSSSSDSGQADDADGGGCGAGPSLQDILLQQIRPRLVEVVSQYELPPAPGAPPCRYKFVLPPTLARMRVAPDPHLAVVPLPYKAGPRARHVGVAVAAWPLRELRPGEEVTRCPLTLGLADYSSQGFWKASYAAVDSTHEWYTEDGAQDRLLVAVNRLAPPPTASTATDPTAVDPTAAGPTAWAARRTLVAGCGNSALGYEMWDKQGYPEVHNVDYVGEVVGRMAARYGVEGGRPVGDTSFPAAPPPPGDVPTTDDAALRAISSPSASASASASAAPSAASAAPSVVLSDCSSDAGDSSAGTVAAAGAEDSVHGGGVFGGAAGDSGLHATCGSGGECCSSSTGLCEAGFLDTSESGLLAESGLDPSGAGPSGLAPSGPDPSGAGPSGAGRALPADVGCSVGRAARSFGAEPSRFGRVVRDEGVVRWMVGDLTAMTDTPDGLYDLVVDKATLDALMCPEVLNPDGSAEGDAAPAAGAGWREGGELGMVFKYVAEMHRVTGPHARFLIVTLRQPDAIGRLVDAAAEWAAAEQQQRQQRQQEGRAEGDAEERQERAEQQQQESERTRERTQERAHEQEREREGARDGEAWRWRRWRVAHCEPLEGGSDGQPLKAHLYVLEKAM
ncbi:hypothetical protein HYH03_014045 [Edaphochlamys debaryana]|uniref:Uncharacterized protein n=1 Tax=Edaphochlamys debaryana TaxID=47281 RepID=A0A836BTY4_9CHLO|nr:hypothetical protein HYH03_014045 [Edaphochlamys debaryana]|eukprot:KAG2487329.1 hypothetical protein HYH03_014045 [Edaphochlamys debaryana]